MAPRVLRNLRIDDVSSVDQGAGRGVRVVLTKRHVDIGKHKDGVPAIYGKPIVFGADLPAEAYAYLKREFTQDERQAAADKGHALPDGSYPIENKQDLKNAIQAVGRAKDPAKAKAHIKARAKDLGATDMLPESWSKRAVLVGIAAVVAEQVAKGAMDFTTAAGMIDAWQDAGELMCALRDALHALDCSMQSIMNDDDVDDKQGAIATSYEQFKTYLDDLAVDDDDTEKRDMANDPAVSPAVQKIIDDAVAAAVAKAAGDKDVKIAKMELELAIAKMSAKHKAYADSLNGDAQKAFAAMTPDQRDAEMEKTQKRAEDDPIYKRMAAENDDLRKRLTAIEDERELDIAKRDAKEMGLTAEDAGIVLMKARRGDREAMKKYEGYMLTLAKSKAAIEKTGKIFAEFGTANTGATGASAHDEIVAKAAELRKSKPDLTEAKAYEHVLLDPANRDLKKRESDERMAKIYRVAS